MKKYKNGYEYSEGNRKTTIVSDWNTVYIKRYNDDIGDYMWVRCEFTEDRQELISVQYCLEKDVPALIPLSEIDIVASNDVSFHWHDVSEKPKFPCKVVMLFDDDTIDSGDYEDFRDWRHDAKDYGVTFWCYWGELIPKEAEK